MVLVVFFYSGQKMTYQYVVISVSNLKIILYTGNLIFAHISLHIAILFAIIWIQKIFFKL